MPRLRVSVGWFAVTAPLNTPISVVVSFTGAEGGRTKFQFAPTSKSLFNVPLQTLDAPNTLDPSSVHIATKKKTAEQLRQRDLHTRPASQNVPSDIKWSPVLANSFSVTQLVGAVPVRSSRLRIRIIACGNYVAYPSVRAPFAIQIMSSSPPAYCSARNRYGSVSAHHFNDRLAQIVEARRFTQHQIDIRGLITRLVN
jgi:hypothetical protein